MEELLKASSDDALKIRTMDVSVEYSDDYNNNLDIEELMKLICNN